LEEKTENVDRGLDRLDILTRKCNELFTSLDGVMRSQHTSAVQSPSTHGVHFHPSHMAAPSRLHEPSVTFHHPQPPAAPASPRSYLGSDAGQSRLDTNNNNSARYVDIQKLVASMEQADDLEEKLLNSTRTEGHRDAEGKSESTRDKVDGKKKKKKVVISKAPKKPKAKKTTVATGSRPRSRSHERKTREGGPRTKSKTRAFR